MKRQACSMCQGTDTQRECEQGQCYAEQYQEQQAQQQQADEEAYWQRQWERRIEEERDR